MKSSEDLFRFFQKVPGVSYTSIQDIIRCASILSPFFPELEPRIDSIERAPALMYDDSVTYLDIVVNNNGLTSWYIRDKSGNQFTEDDYPINKIQFTKKLQEMDL